jgi:hypothetical protein
MIKNSILFYVFLVVFIIITSVISFEYGMLIWYGISVIGNSVIIHKAIKQKPVHKMTLIIISSLFILLPILCGLFILFAFSGITC